MTSTPRATPLPPLVSLPFIAMTGARAVLSLFPDAPLWGLSYLAFLPIEVLAALTLLSIVAAFPTVSLRLESGLAAAGGLVFPEDARRGLATHAVIALACGVLFWQLVVPFSFLGDGVHVVRALLRSNEGAGLAAGTLWAEPASVLVLNALARAFGGASVTMASVHIEGYTLVFMAAAAVLGTAWVFFVLRYARVLRADARDRLVLVLALVGAAGLLFFFGYVEFYAFLYLFGTLYLLEGARELSEGKSPLLSSLLLLAAVAFHLTALVFLPAHLYLCRHRSALRAGRPAPSRRQLLAAAAAVLALAGAVYIALNAAGRNSLFIPFGISASEWVLLSPQHVMDLASNVLLLAPAAVAALALLLRRDARIAGSPALTFAALAALFWLAFCFSHSAIARDWDVYALLGAALALAAALAAGQLPAQLRAYAGTQLAVQSLLFVIPWIALNVSFQPSLDRFLTLTELYRPLLPAEVSAGHYETLRSAFAAARNPEGQIAMIGSAVALTGERYEYYKLTRVYEEATSLTPAMLAAAERSLATMHAYPDSVRRLPVGRDAHSAAQTLDDVAVNLTRAVVRLLPAEQRGQWAAAALEPLLTQEVRRFELSSYIGYRLFDARDYRRAIEWMTRALRDTAAAPATGRETIYVLHHGLGIAYAKTGDEARCIASLRQAVTYAQAPASTWSDYGFACYTYARFAEAAPAFARALARDSTDANALYCLGKIYFIDPAAHETGRRLLRLFLARESGTPRANDAREIIDLTPEQLRGMTFTK